MVPPLVEDNIHSLPRLLASLIGSIGMCDLLLSLVPMLMFTSLLVSLSFCNIQSPFLLSSLALFSPLGGNAVRRSTLTSPSPSTMNVITTIIPRLHVGVWPTLQPLDVSRARTLLPDVRMRLIFYEDPTILGLLLHPTSARRPLPSRAHGLRNCIPSPPHLAIAPVPGRAKHLQ